MNSPTVSGMSRLSYWGKELVADRRDFPDTVGELAVAQLSKLAVRQSGARNQDGILGYMASSRVRQQYLSSPVFYAQINNGNGIIVDRYG